MMEKKLRQSPAAALLYRTCRRLQWRYRLGWLGEFLLGAGAGSCLFAFSWAMNLLPLWSLLVGGVAGGFAACIKNGWIKRTSLSQAGLALDTALQSRERHVSLAGLLEHPERAENPFTPAFVDELQAHAPQADPVRATGPLVPERAWYALVPAALLCSILLLTPEAVRKSADERGRMRPVDLPQDAEAIGELSLELQTAMEALEQSGPVPPAVEKALREQADKLASALEDARERGGDRGAVEGEALAQAEHLLRRARAILARQGGAEPIPGGRENPSAWRELVLYEAEVPPERLAGVAKYLEELAQRR